MLHPKTNKTWDTGPHKHKDPPCPRQTGIPETMVCRILIWVVVKIMVPFWVLGIIRHLIFRGPKRGPLLWTTTHIYVAPGLPFRNSAQPNPRASAVPCASRPPRRASHLELNIEGSRKFVGGLWGLRGCGCGVGFHASEKEACSCFRFWNEFQRR